MVNKIPQFWKNPIEALLVVALLLVALGLLNIFSASFVVAGQQYHDSYFYVKRHLMVFGLGMMMLFVCAKLDYRQLRGRPLGYLVLGTIALLVLVPIMGLDANGAKRWIRLAGINFQPSEIAKLTAIFLSAAYLGPRLERHRYITLMSQSLVISIIMGFLVLRQPDMGTASVIVGLCLGLYLLAGIPKRQAVGLVAIFGVAGVYLAFAASYRAERIYAWLDPWAYQQGIGYQTVQSLLAIGSGGFWGLGVGAGSSKFYYLPEAHTDFAFAVLCQELGFVGAFFVIFLIVAVGIYGVKIALNAPDGFGVILGMGLTALIVGQAVANIAMVIGLIPVTGVPLPFISYGGTSLIVNLTAIGLLMSIGRRATVEPPLSAVPKLPQPPPKRRLKLVRNNS